ncbi:MAG TPA: acetate/propionate family kinase [Schlesneria sp.]|jgi:acetate kinase
MSDALLVLNAGSSSLKFSVFRNSDPPELLLRGQLESLLSTPRFIAHDVADNVLDEREWPADSTLGHASAIEFLFDWGQRGQLGELRLTAAGHRVVHGGMKFTQPVRVDDGVLADLETLVPLAPLHQPHNIAAIRAVASHAPALPQVACFDTSFHRTQPSVAQHFAIPRKWTESGVQRYGFHGLSYEYIAKCLPQIDPKAASGRTVVAHLGNGASLCAMQAGVSIATTMSFTPLDGLVMGTRCGAIDPGVLLYLMNQHGLDARDLERLLTQESGLLGVSGISSDMRTLLEREATNAHAAEAIDLFVYRISREIGSLAAALGGLDAIVFTGGIGEHGPAIRARICQGARWLGLEFDNSLNQQGARRISAADSQVAAWVIPTNEELMIAQHTQQILKPTPTN